MNCSPENEDFIFEEREPIDESSITMNDSDNNVLEIPPSIYFGGCACGVVFYIGVYQAMIDRWGADFPQKTVIYGDSAAVIIVLAITRQLSPQYIGELYKEFGKNSPYGMLSGCFPLEENILKNLVDNFKDPSLHEKLKGRMFIGKSHFFAKHVWKNEWESLDDLYKCIVDSFNIPILCDSKNKSTNAFVDGAFIFSGKDLPDGDATLYVADDIHADITTVFTNKEMFFVNLNEDYDRLYQNGYNAFMAWDGKYKQKVGFRKSKYGIQCLLWVLFVIEKIGNFCCSIFRFFCKCL